MSYAGTTAGRSDVEKVRVGLAFATVRLRKIDSAILMEAPAG